MYGYNDEQLAQMSKEEMIEALKKHIHIRDQMGGALYLAILTDECIELAEKCISLGANRKEIMALL